MRSKTLSGLFASVFVALVGSAFLGMPEVARADDCRPTCRQAKKTCIDAGKSAYRGCREDCYGSSDRRACRRSCRDPWKEAKAVCGDAIRDCRDACTIAPIEPICEHCQPELRLCLHEVADQGRTCSHDCLKSRGQAMRDCRREFFPFLCYLEVARDAAVCLRDCSVDIRDGGQNCHSGFRQCREDCLNPPPPPPPPSPYGSASEAFMLSSDGFF